jgi:nucleotide-binding universal stress UspA family protein
MVVGTDFSETADLALDYAIALARSFNAEIVVVHAYEMPAYSFPDGAVMAGDLLQRLEAASEEALVATLRARQQSGVKLRTVLRMGAPWKEIASVAEAENADMIVVGTHGRRGVARVLLGSVAERVVRTAPCPVLTVGQTKH